MSVRILTAKQVPALYVGRAHWEHKFRNEGLWPRFFELSRHSDRYSELMDERYPQFQFVAVDDADRVIGVAHSVPVSAPIAMESLPMAGWDWAVQNSLTNSNHNMLCGLSVTVRAAYQGRGLGSLFVRQLISASASQGFTRLIVPARPVLKQNRPLCPMHLYLSWKRSDGLHHDPWIRTHQRLGGKIVGVCDCSMTMTGRLEEWRKVTGEALDTTGKHIVAGCLVPIEVDVEVDFARYIEPNVWIAY